jgi:hypothetical protein
MSRATRAVVVTLFVLAAVVTGGPAEAATSPWVAQGSDRARPLDESQGLATVVRPGGTQIRYTGVGTIPLDLRGQGWEHVGDPDAHAGWYIEPYQHANRAQKLFRVQNPAGAWANYTHEVLPWEERNNSFVAVAPDGRWMVSGEYGTKDRLLVYPTPGIAVTTAGTDIPYSAAIRLDRAVRDVQGCDFVTGTRLLCSSDDPDGTLFGMTRPLLQIDLSRPVDGRDVTAAVTALGQLPLQSACRGSFEVQGIDYSAGDGTLRVIVMSPSWCVAFDSKTWRLRQD